MHTTCNVLKMLMELLGGASIAGQKGRVMCFILVSRPQKVMAQSELQLGLNMNNSLKK